MCDITRNEQILSAESPRRINFFLGGWGVGIVPIVCDSSVWN
jgi:hypothetical protein